uniref:Uncharacterized protein n=1 Tax=Rhizophora mucronata TaxID=61149 RepID=A0A2P2PKW0_RHIMU
MFYFNVELNGGVYNQDYVYCLEELGYDNELTLFCS